MSMFWRRAKKISSALPPALTRTATEKLMMLGLPAVLNIYVDHMIMRDGLEDIDFKAVEKAADRLRQIAWKAERRQKGYKT